MDPPLTPEVTLYPLLQNVIMAMTILLRSIQEMPPEYLRPHFDSLREFPGFTDSPVEVEDEGTPNHRVTQAGWSDTPPSPGQPSSAFPSSSPTFPRTPEESKGHDMKGDTEEPVVRAPNSTQNRLRSTQLLKAAPKPASVKDHPHTPSFVPSSPASPGSPVTPAPEPTPNPWTDQEVSQLKEIKLDLIKRYNWAYVAKLLRRSEDEVRAKWLEIKPQKSTGEPAKKKRKTE